MRPGEAGGQGGLWWPGATAPRHALWPPPGKRACVPSACVPARAHCPAACLPLACTLCRIHLPCVDPISSLVASATVFPFMFVRPPPGPSTSYLFSATLWFPALWFPTRHANLIHAARASVSWNALLAGLMPAALITLCTPFSLPLSQTPTHKRMPFPRLLPGLPRRRACQPLPN